MNKIESKFYDLQQLKDALAGRIDEFIITLFPAAHRENSCYKIGNLQGEKGTSLMISTRSTNPGWFIDYSDVSVTGHAWRLVSLVKGISLKDGIAWVANFCNVPPIQSFGNVNHAKNPEQLAAKIRSLTEKSIAYAKSRGLTEETLLKYGVGSDVRNGLVFPYYDAFDQLGMIKHWGHELKADGKKDTWTSPEPVMSLFGKDVCDPETGLQRLVITEGECLSGDTEVLTTQGWIALESYVSMAELPKVAQWGNWKLSWTKPNALIVKEVDPNQWLHFSHHQMDQITTHGHRMIYHHNGVIKERLASEWPKNTNFEIPKAGFLNGEGIDLTDDQIRLTLAISADAAIDHRKNTHYHKGKESRYARFGFNKMRKVIRLRQLLESCNIKASDTVHADGKHSICFSIPAWFSSKILPWEWIEKATLNQRQLILDELVHWDGNSVPNRKQVEYASKHIENATWVQTMASTAGIASTIIPRSNHLGSWFKVSILHGKSHCGHQKKPKAVYHGDTAYCLNVDTGALIIRRNHKICITGNCDAMACWQLGIPAVSIPMGVSNMQWITEDYQFLSHFDEIVLLFDSDEPGKKAAKDVAARLGTERCLICRLPLKDANDMLKAGRGGEIKTIIETTTKEPIAEIVDPASMKEGVKSYMKGEHLSDGDPFFLPSFDISFRKHEVTLWFGFSFHGKSQAVQNQMAYLASRGKASCIASFEQPPELTLSQIITCAAAYPNLPFTDEFDAAYDYMTRNVFMYKSMDRACPKHLVSTFIHAHKRYGIDTFVIDNVMTMSIDRGDNTAQAEAMDLLRMFVSKYPVHLHIVAHPRKPPEKTTNPPGMAEIRGASEWGDMPHNIITVWRDMAKAERIAEMENDGFSDGEMKDYYNSSPCGKLIVRKQRTTGETPMTSFFFHKPTKRFTSKAGEPNAMFSQKPW